MSSAIEQVHHNSYLGNSGRAAGEADCSSPTSWMFMAAETPPAVSFHSLRGSIRNGSNSGNNNGSNESNPGRNSSESSAGSYRSQDSGFSDAGENWAARRKTSVHESFVAVNEEAYEISKHEEQQVIREDIYASPCTCSMLSPTRSYQGFPTMRLRSGSCVTQQTEHEPSTKLVDVTYSCQVQQQEVILAHPSRSRLNALQADAMEELGAPACSSTPKRPAHLMRPSIMHKIDNFQSLNKNAQKVTDSNNNSSNSNNGSFKLSKSSNSGRGNRSITPLFGKSARSSASSLHRKQNSLVEPPLPSEEHGHLGSIPGDSHKAFTLPRGFKKRTPPPNTVVKPEPVVVRSVAENQSLRLWLHELRQHAEPECLSTLQVKAIESEPMDMTWQAQETFPASPSRLSVTVLAIHSVSAPIISIRSIEQRACVITTQFSKLCKHLELGFFTRVPPLITSLSSNIEEFLREYRDSLGRAHKLERHIVGALRNLRTASRALDAILVKADDLEDTNVVQGSPRCLVNVSLSEANQILEEIVEEVVAISNMFRLMVDEKLTRDLSSILDTIENGGLPALVGLQSFMTILTDGGAPMCRIAASIRTVRGLLASLLDTKDEYAKVLALRTLAILLCVGEAVRDFDNAGGFELVTDILGDEFASAALKTEALSVLAQASDPWLDLETTLSNLGGQMEKMIYILTQLIPVFKGQQDTFLLLVATISNLTFLETSSLRILKRHHTVWHLLSAIREHPSYSVFILDHVATVLANMSGVEKCRKGIIAAGGIVALLCFLQQTPRNFSTLPEITACERVQQKSTIAISRLSNEEGVARMIIEMNGLERIIELCRQEKERNYSDGVLIACLATLRKLVSTCKEETVRSLAAEDLIQPRLLDSFLMYSSRQESYV